MSDTELLNWLEKCEFCLVTHREKTEDFFEIWWTVTTARGRALTHPYGNVRAAILAAQKATNQDELKPANRREPKQSSVPTEEAKERG